MWKKTTPFQSAFPVAVAVFLLLAGGCSTIPKGDRKEAERYLRRGLVLREAGNFLGAAECFAKAAALDPSYARAHVELGVEFLRGGVRLEDAEKHFRTALKLDPDLWEARHFLVDTLRCLRKFEQAVQEQELLVEQRPRWPEGYNNLGDLYLRLRRFEKAEQAFRRAVSLRADYGKAWGGLGTALWRRGKITEGIAALRKAVGLLPEDVELRLEIARALIAAGQPELARQEAQTALRLEPDNGVVYHVLAEAAVAEGKKDEARAYARQAVIHGCRLTRELRDKLELTAEELREALRQ